MKLDPVYVLAPRPAAPAMPTRRAFLFAGAAFLGGAAAGSAGGWWFGTRSTPAASGGRAVEPEDPTLAWLHELCREASIEELAKERTNLTFELGRRGDDEILRQGFVRLCMGVASDRSLEGREAIAAQLIDMLDRAPALADMRQAGWVPALRRAAGGR